jgi:hypothetical protein
MSENALAVGWSSLPARSRYFSQEQTLDDGRAGGRCAQAFFAHGGAQFLVVDQFASAFHGAEERGLGEAGWWFGLIRDDLERGGSHAFAGLHLAPGWVIRRWRVPVRKRQASRG